jgi:hypothetical protein
VIASLVWKEYREHRSIWIAMAVVTVASLVIATEWQLPQGWKQGEQDSVASIVAAAFILSGMYGLVCGAMMFAGERESRGMPFLDTLPLGRGELWWAKLFIGAVFVLLFSAVVIATGAALGLVGRGAIHPVLTLLVPAVALESYVLGLCASTFCRTVLTAVAVAALLPMPVLGFCSGMLLAVHPTEGGTFALVPVVLVFHGLAMVGALGMSLSFFYDRDFEKRFALKPAASSYGTVAPKRQPRRYEVMLWLSLRRGGILAGVLAVVGFLMGLGLPAVGAALWPVAALFLGVACGTAVFAGEQFEGSFKFWGDQRLPVGWLWLRRTALWGGIMVGVAGLMLLAALLHVVGKERGAGEEAGPLLDKALGLPANVFGLGGALAFLVLWPAYGFAVGQLCCLVWRKTAVAVVVALMTAAGAASLWVPSLVGGGLHLVQVLGAPLLLLGACRVALWDWVTDRLRTRQAVARLVGGVVIACAWVGINLAVRVLEVPGGAEPFDRADLQTRLTGQGEIQRAAKIRQAMGMIGEREQPKGQDFVPRRDVAPPVPYRDMVRHVVEQGWPAGPERPADPASRLRGWLKEMTADPWPTLLTEGAAERPGVLIDPRDESQTGVKDAAEARRTGELMTARALMLQADGEDERALEALLTVLALSRHLRHQAPAYAYLEGVETERVALVGLGHWLSRAGRRPDLLRRALDGLQAHEKATPPVGEALEAEYYRFQRGLGTKTDRVGGLSREMEAQLMQVPWEAARARRLAAAVFAGRRRAAESGAVVAPGDDSTLADWEPGADGPTSQRLASLLGSSWLAAFVPATAPLQRSAQLALCGVRAARLQVALTLYQCEQGKAAPSLDALVPGLLPELPEDPFSHDRFRYRVSKGEQIAWPRQLAGGGEEFVRQVPAGQGVLWSPGPDGSDDGGTRQWDKYANGPGRDVIFLVPLPQGR